MKTLVFYVNSMLPAGGIERVISTLVSKLNDGVKIVVLLKDKPESFYPLPAQVNIVSLDIPLFIDMNKSRLNRMFHLITNLILIRRKLKEKLVSFDYDYIYVTNPYNCLELRIAGVSTNTLLLSEHGAREAFNPIYKALKKLFYKKCKCLIVPTETDSIWYKERGYPSVYIPHFRSVLNYERVDIEKNKTVLNIGRFTQDKQQLLLLDIWSNIIKNYNLKDWTLTLVGEGELENDIFARIRIHQLEKYVNIISPKKTVGDFYKSSSVFCLTSRAEGFSMVLVEAISYGIPCLSFNCPVGPQEVLKGNSGILIDCFDSKMFEEYLVKVMTDFTFRKNVADRGYERSQNWDDDIILRKWYEILNENE